MRVHKGNGYALELNEQDTKTVLHAIELSEGEPLENCVATADFCFEIAAAGPLSGLFSGIRLDQCAAERVSF